jgi:hypothetical protein
MALKQKTKKEMISPTEPRQTDLALLLFHDLCFLKSKKQKSKNCCANSQLR